MARKRKNKKKSPEVLPSTTQREVDDEVDFSVYTPEVAQYLALHEELSRRALRGHSAVAVDAFRKAFKEE